MIHNTHIAKLIASDHIADLRSQAAAPRRSRAHAEQIQRARRAPKLRARLALVAKGNR